MTSSLWGAEWVASTVQWFTRHVVATVAVVTTGLGGAGIIEIVRALDWSLILQWVVGACWVILCVFIAYKVNQKINNMTHRVREEGERETVEPPAEKQTRASSTTGTSLDRTSSADTKAWIAEAEALAMIRASSLVRLRLPRETLIVGEVFARLGGAPSRTEVDRRADEIARHLLRKFKNGRSWGVRGGTYDRRLLEEWIDETAYQE